MVSGEDCLAESDIFLGYTKINDNATMELITHDDLGMKKQKGDEMES